MGDEIVGKRIEKIFPDYFNRFIMPEGAHEERIKVYRACKNGTCDPMSFLPSYEENGYELDPLLPDDDPGQFSLSTFEKPKDVKRWANINREPYKIAVGFTEPKHGLVQRTRERTGTKTSHVDWWLYKDARPYEEFEIIDDFCKYLDDYNK